MKLEIKKSEINHQQLAAQLLLPYTNGNATIEDTYTKLLHLQKVIELAQSELKEKMCDFARENKSYTTNGIEINFRAGTKRAVFEDNPIIDAAAARLESLQDISKSLARSGGKPVADIETGELIYPCYFKESPDTFSVTFKAK